MFSKVEELVRNLENSNSEENRIFLRRDLFAAFALLGLLSNRYHNYITDRGLEGTVKKSYEFADAMNAERTRK